MKAILEKQHHLEAAVFTLGALVSFLFHHYVTRLDSLIDLFGNGLLSFMLLTYFVSYCFSFLPKYRQASWAFCYMALVYFICHASHLIIGFLMSLFVEDEILLQLKRLRIGDDLIFPVLPFILVFLSAALPLALPLYQYLIGKKGR